jgi:capsid protein
MTSWRARVGAWVGGFGIPGGFDATSGQRRLKGFVTSRAHVNALIAASGPEMNARARWLVRNNGYAANAIESWAANTVGDGISGDCQLGLKLMFVPTPRIIPRRSICTRT